MQISLTKKLISAAKIVPGTRDDSINPLFCWIANWTNTFDDRKEDMIVLMNQATYFTVSIYGVRKKDFADFTDKMETAIRNTLKAMKISNDIIDEYFQLAGSFTLVPNNDRKLTAALNRRCLEAAFVVGRAVLESNDAIEFDDTMGLSVSKGHVNTGGSPSEASIPATEMVKALTKLTGKSAYNYRAFELLATLDLEIYAATRRFIVPADISFDRMHLLLQNVFSWDNCHLYDFAVYSGRKVVTRIVPDEMSLDYDDKAVLMDGLKLSDYMPKHRKMLYTYDMGDSWEHEIKLLRVINKHDQPSPYLLEASGQTPPDDVGGVYGFIRFREIIMDKKHPEYEEMKMWGGFWKPELSEWKKKPKEIDI